MTIALWELRYDQSLLATAVAFARYAVIAVRPGKFPCSGIGVPPAIEIEHVGQTTVADRVWFHCRDDGGNHVADGDSVAGHGIVAN